VSDEQLSDDEFYRWLADEMDMSVVNVRDDPYPIHITAEAWQRTQARLAGLWILQRDNERLRQLARDVAALPTWDDRCIRCGRHVAFGESHTEKCEIGRAVELTREGE